MPADRYLAIGIENAYGDGTASYDIFIPIEDESINETTEYKEEKNIQNRSVVEAYVVRQHVEGPFTMRPKPSSLGILSKILLGRESVNGTTKTHTYTPATIGSTCPSATVRVYRDISKETAYGGCQLDGEFTASVGEPLLLSASVFGARAKTVGGNGTTPSWKTDTPYILTSGSISILGGTNARVKDVSFSIANEYDTAADTTLGAAYPKDMREQGLVVGGKLTMSRPNGTMYSYHRNGSTTALVLVLNAKSANGTTQPCTISMPKIYITEAGEGNISARELNTQDYTFRAVYDAGSAYAMRMVVVNSDATAYGA